MQGWRQQSLLLMRNIESGKSSISALNAFTIHLQNNIETIQYQFRPELLVTLGSLLEEVAQYAGSSN